MSKHNLPKEPAPLSVWGYWQESLQAWSDFSQQASKIVLGQIAGGSKSSKPLDADADTLATEILRTFSDVNLRHWQNTARLLESYPAWMQVPQSMNGSALVDWFDKFQTQAGYKASASDQVSPETDALARPETLPKPIGEADDLTRIKGIGPKLSGRLNDLGIFHFKQIANWSEADAVWVEDNITHKGRVAREAWVSQARVLSANGSSTLH